MAYYGSFGNFGGAQQGFSSYNGGFAGQRQIGGFGAAPQQSFAAPQPYGSQSFGSYSQFGAPQLGAQQSFAAPQQFAPQQFGQSFGQPQFSQGFNSRFGAPQQFGASAAPYYGQQQFGGFNQGFSNNYGFVGQQGATVTAGGPAGFSAYNSFGAGQFGAPQPFGQPEFNGLPENTQKNTLDLSQYVRSTAVPAAGNDESPVSAALDGLKGDIEAARKAAENSPKA